MTADPMADPVALMASGEIPEPVRTLVMNAAQEAIDDSEAADAEAEFWTGFIDAVREYQRQVLDSGWGRTDGRDQGDRDAP